MSETDPRICVSSIIATARAHRAAVDRQVRMGLPIHRSQHMMLMMIARESGAFTQKDISTKLDISEAAVTACLRRLEKEGYIIRTADISDGRSRRICLTDAGREIVAKTEGLFREMDVRMFAGVSETEKKMLCDLLSRLRENLSSVTGDGTSAEMATDGTERKE